MLKFSRSNSGSLIAINPNLVRRIVSSSADETQTLIYFDKDDYVSVDYPVERVEVLITKAIS
jgi:hypothetical protein